MDDAERARRSEALAQAIFVVLERGGGTNDAQLAIGSVGAVIGCLALASNEPPAFMAAIAKVAQGVIDGSLLDG